MVASIAEPHILLTVVQPAERQPALSAACRAARLALPAGSTQPISVLSTSAG